MKPWFENEKLEADIIKFPEPERKVIKMPSVSEYPDFITGVLDLQARRDKGQIGQDSYDKLYQDLIQRFMKRESFEHPWFLREAMVSTASSPESAAMYIQSINNLLKKNKPIQVGGQKKDKKMFTPAPGQQITSFKDSLKGELNGVTTTIKAGQIYKSEEIKGAKADYNKGNVAEGIFGAGIYLALITPARSISTNILTSFILRSLTDKNGIAISGTNTRTKDKVSLSVRLSENNFTALTDSKSLNTMQGEIQSIVDYVNGEEIAELEKSFAENRKIDDIHVVADGLSDEDTSKVDVYVKFADGVVKYERSVKTGNVTQFGQASTGGAKDTLSTEERYDLQEEFWSTWGIDISRAQKDFEDSERDFLQAYDFSYKVAAEELAKLFTTNKKEKNNIPEFIKTIQYHAYRDNPNAKMIKFSKEGYTVLDFKKLDNFVDKIDLKAVYNPPTERKTSSGDYVRARPEIHIVDQEGRKFMSFRLYATEKKVTNLIEQGPLLTKITRVSSNIK
jgi:hypothetical protein